MMMLSFLARSFGPGLAWLLLVTSYPWWKDAAGVAGVVLLTLLQALALAATLLLTAGREKTLALLSEVASSFPSGASFAKRLVSCGLMLFVVVLFFALPALLYASEGLAVTQGVRGTWAFGLLGLIALAGNGWTWQAFSARDGRDASGDLAVRSWMALAAALRPSLPFVATLGAAAVLLFLGALAGSLATEEALRDRLRKAVEAEVKAGGGRAVPDAGRLASWDDEPVRLTLGDVVDLVYLLEEGSPASRELLAIAAPLTEVAGDAHGARPDSLLLLPRGRLGRILSLMSEAERRSSFGRIAALDPRPLGLQPWLPQSQWGPEVVEPLGKVPAGLAFLRSLPTQENGRNVETPGGTVRVPTRHFTSAADADAVRRAIGHVRAGHKPLPAAAR